MNRIMTNATMMYVRVSQSGVRELLVVREGIAGGSGTPGGA